MFKKLLLPAPLRRSYADAGDFLRVVSIFFVGWYHIWLLSWLNPNFTIFGTAVNIYPLVACGYMFVDLMLLLSGFLLMLGYLSGRVRSWRDFYIARAARILPSYLLCIAVMFLLTFILPENAYGSGKHLWTDLLSHLSFTHNFFPESYTHTRLNGALWTLAVEVQFYLIFPLLARAFRKHPARTYLAMVFTAFCIRAAIALFAQDSSIYINRLTAMLDVYANGMLAAHIYQRLKKLRRETWFSWCCTALTILSAALVYSVFRMQFPRSGMENIRMGQLLWRFPLSVLGAVFLVCGSLSVRGLRLLLSNRLVRFLSGVSFNFYIWHQFIAARLKAWRIPSYTGSAPHADAQQPWQLHYTLLSFTAAIIISTLLTYLVEKPCGKWIKSRLSSRKDT